MNITAKPITKRDNKLKYSFVTGYIVDFCSGDDPTMLNRTYSITLPDITDLSVAINVALNSDDIQELIKDGELY